MDLQHPVTLSAEEAEVEKRMDVDGISEALLKSDGFFLLVKVIVVYLFKMV